MTVISEAEIRVNVDLSDLKTYHGLLDKVANGSMKVKDAQEALEQQVKSYEEELARTKENTLQWIEVDEKLKKAKEELKKAADDEGKGWKAAAEEAKQLAKDEKDAAKEAEKTSKELEKLTQKVASFLGQYFAIKKSISAVMGFAKEGEELARMAQLSGTSAESIEKLGIALKNYGGSASSASSTLGKLNRQMEDLKLGKKNNLYQVAVQYGLNTNAKTPEDMLRNIAKRMEGMGALQQVNMGRKLGLDDATIMLLQQGLKGLNQELDKASKLTVFSDEDIKNADKMQRAYREFQAKLDQLKATLLHGLLPVFEVLFKRLSAFADYLKEHPKILKAVAAAVTLLTSTFLVSKSISFAASLLRLGTVFKLLRSINLAPMLPIITKLGSAVLKMGMAFASGLTPLLPYIAALMALAAAFMAVSKAAEGVSGWVLDKIRGADNERENEKTATLASFTDEEKAQIIKGEATFDDIAAKHKSSVEVGQAYVKQADSFPLNSSSASAASIMNNNSKSQDKTYNFNFGGVTIEADNPKEFMEKFGNKYGLQFANGFE